jgi:hypothetical protein
MKPFLAASALLLVCALLVFLAPHHRRVQGDIRSCTLGAIYAEIVSSAYTSLVKGMPSGPSARGAIWLALLAATAMLAAAFPVFFVGLTQWWPSPDNRGMIYVIAGVLAVIGAGSNFLAMLVSHMMIGWGVSNSSQDQTVFIWIIPAFQALFGLASIVAGCSERFAGWLNHCLN